MPMGRKRLACRVCNNSTVRSGIRMLFVTQGQIGSNILPSSVIRLCRWV